MLERFDLKLSDDVETAQRQHVTHEGTDVGFSLSVTAILATRFDKKNWATGRDSSRPHCSSLYFNFLFCSTTTISHRSREDMHGKQAAENTFTFCTRTHHRLRALGRRSVTALTNPIQFRYATHYPRGPLIRHPRLSRPLLQHRDLILTLYFGLHLAKRGVGYWVGF